MMKAPQIAWCCRLTAAVVAALALWSAPSAQAAPPTIESAVVAEGRQLLVIWKLPPGMKNYIVEAATSPQVNPDGPEKGFFPASTRASLSITTGGPETHWILPDQFPSGTYYVHVGAYDGTACPGVPVGCEIEFSEVSQVVVPLLPPVITSATSAQRNLRLDWMLPVGMASLFAEVATSPDVYATGSLQGQFLTENVVTSHHLLTETTTYRSPSLPGGTYYAHVGARDRIACSIDDGRPCPIAVSAPVAVVVPRDPPVLRTLDLTDHLRATWTLPTDLVSAYIEVATSPEVYADGEFRGEFLAQNTVFFDVLYEWERSYESLEPLGLGPGTYWVHVGGNVRYTSLSEASDPVAFTIPGPPGPPPAAPAVAQAPATEAKIGKLSLRVAGRQSVRRLVVSAVANHPGRLTATGTIPVPGRARTIRLRRTSAPTKAGARVRLRLRLSRRDLRTVRSILRRKPLKAWITVTARDEAGNARSAKRIVRLMR